MKKLILLLIFVMVYTNIFSEYFINTAAIPIDNYVKEYNFYADVFKKKSGINIYFYMAIAPKGMNSENEIKNYLEGVKSKVYNQIVSQNKGEKTIIVIYELKRNQGTILKNFSEEPFENKNLQNIISEYIDPFFEYIFYRIESKTGKIKESIKQEEIFSEKYRDYLFNEVYGLIGLSFLEGVGELSGIELNISEERKRLFKNGDFRGKVALFEEEIKQKRDEEEKRAEDEKERNLREAIRIKEERAEREKVALEEKQKRADEERERAKEEEKKRTAEIQKSADDKKKAEEIANKWDSKMNINLSYEYNSTDSTLADKTVINPMTGLVDEVQEKRRDGKAVITARPSFVSKENGKLEASLSYVEFRDYLNSDNNYSKPKFDFLKGLYFGDTYTLYVNIGDFEMEKGTNFLILNSSYRGYMGGIQYYLNYNPDKWSYKEKIKKGEIKGDSIKSIRATILSVPQGEMLGVKTTQKETMGFLVEGFLTQNEDKENKDKYHIGFVYGNAQDNETIEKNIAQNILFEGSTYLFEKNLLRTSLNYIMTVHSTSDSGIEKSGSKLEVKSSYKFGIFESDYVSLFGRYNKNSEDLYVGMVSKTYSGTDKPTFFNDKDIESSSGYEISMENSLFNKKYTNYLYYSDFTQTKDGEYNGARKEFIWSGNGTLGEKVELGGKYSSLINYEDKKEDYFAIATQKFSLNESLLNKKYTLEILDENGRETGEYKNEFVLNNGYITPKYEVNKKYKTDILNYEKQKISLSTGTEASFGNFENNLTLYGYKTDYKYVNDDSFNGGRITDNFSLGKSGLYLLKTGVSSYENKPLQKKSSLFSNYLSKSLEMNAFDLFEENSEMNVSASNYSYNGSIKETPVKDLSGNSFTLFLPVKPGWMKNFNSRENVIFRENKNNISGDIQKNISASTKNIFKLDKRLEIYGNITYIENRLTTLDVDKAANISESSDEDNVGITADVNNSINKITDKIENDNSKSYDYEAGFKYSLLNTEVIASGKAVKVFEVKAIAGGGYEDKEIFLSNLEYKSIYANGGSEIFWKINDFNVIRNSISWKPYFSEGEYIKQKITESGGYLYKSGNFKSALMVEYIDENYKNDDKGLSNSSIKGELNGELSLNSGKTRLQYNSIYSTKNPGDERNIEGNVKFYSKVYGAEKRSNTSNGAINTEFISESNIGASISYTNRNDLTKNYETLGFDSNGSISFCNSANVLSINGGINRKRYFDADFVEENSNIRLSDTQKVTGDVALNSGAEYYVVDVKTESGSDMKTTKNIKIFSKLTVANIAVRNLNLSVDLEYNLERVNDTYRKEFNKGGALISYSF